MKTKTLYLLFAAISFVSAQDRSRPDFFELLKLANVEFVMPAGYLAVTKGNKPIVNYDFAISSTDVELEIRYLIQPFRLEHDSINLHYRFNFDFKDIYKKISGNKYFYPQPFDLEGLRKEYNADAGFTAMTDVKSNFSKKYKHCIITVLHKDNLADIYVFYLFNDYKALLTYNTRRDIYHSIRFNALQSNKPQNKTPVTQHPSPKKGLAEEMRELGTFAFTYRTMPLSQGGGSGSYDGFMIPKQFDSTGVGKYSIYSFTRNELVIRMQYHDQKLSYIFVIDSLGKCGTTQIDWYYAIKQIGKLAYRYRRLPRSSGGGEGSFTGFKIPRHLDSTKYWSFTLYDVQPNEIVLSVKLAKEINSYLYIFDSTGNEKAPDYKQRGNGDEFVKNNNAMVSDMYTIVRSAIAYRNKMDSVGTIKNTFEGFVVPNNLRQTENGQYALVESRKDTLYVKALSSVGSGFMYFRIDYTGKLRQMIEGTYRPPNR